MLSDRNRQALLDIRSNLRLAQESRKATRSRHSQETGERSTQSHVASKLCQKLRATFLRRFGLDTPTYRGAPSWMRVMSIATATTAWPRSSFGIPSRTASRRCCWRLTASCADPSRQMKGPVNLERSAGHRIRGQDAAATGASRTVGHPKAASGAEQRLAAKVEGDSGAKHCK